METLPTLSFGQYNIVFNVFSLSLAAFAASTIFFFMQRSRVAPEYRTAITITGLVTFIALYHYVQILFDWKALSNWSTAPTWLQDSRSTMPIVTSTGC